MSRRYVWPDPPPYRPDRELVGYIEQPQTRARDPRREVMVGLAALYEPIPERPAAVWPGQLLGFLVVVATLSVVLLMGWQL